MSGGIVRRLLSTDDHGDGGPPSGGHGENSLGDPSDGGLVVAMGLLFGIISRVFLNRTRVPYTVLVLLFGVLMGALDHETDMGPISHSIGIWLSIRPEYILFTFLPVLIFESAFSMDTHLFLRELGQALILAVPGVLLSTFLTALIAMGLFDYDWDWKTSLLFGSMLSATDPVAVVALLKELNVDKRLGTLIEGESLLNDGTAIVCFHVFLDMVTGEVDRNGGEIIGYFFQLSAGGVFLGFVTGAALVHILGYIMDDPLAEISLTMVACYGTFYLAEGASHDVHVSGVLALVVTGLYMGYKGKIRVSSSVEEDLHSLWEIAGYVANTLVFFVAGLLIVERALLNDEIGAKDWGYLFVLYIGVHVVRGIMVALMYPMLRRLGYGLDINQAITLWFSGLRGAVGLALALIVKEEHHVEEKTKDRILFHSAGIALLTLLVNGMLMPLLLGYLGLSRESKEAEKMFSRACVRLEDFTEEVVNHHKVDRFLGDADWPVVWMYVPVCNAATYHRRIKKGLHNPGAEVPTAVHRRWNRYEKLYGKEDVGEAKTSAMLLGTGPDLSRASSMESVGDMMLPLVDQPDDEVSAMVEQSHGHKGKDHCRTVSLPPSQEALNEVKSQKAEMAKAARENRTTSVALASSRASTVMMTDHDRALDHGRRRLVRYVKFLLWHQYEQGVVGPNALRVLLDACSKQLDRNEPTAMAHMLIKHMEKGFRYRLLQKLMSYTSKVGFVKKFFVAWFHGYIAFTFDVSATYIEVLSELNSRDFGDHVVADQLSAEVVTELTEMEEHLSEVTETFPEIIRAITTKRAARILLRKEREMIESLCKNGMIEESEQDSLLYSNTVSSVKLEFLSPSMEFPNKRDLLHNLNFMHGLDEATVEKVNRATVEMFYNRNQAIMHAGDVSNGWYVISRGSVGVFVDDDADVPVATLGSGRTVGQLGTLVSGSRSATLRALSIVQAFFCPAQAFMQIMDESPDFKNNVWRAAGVYVADVCIPDFKHLKKVELRQMIMESQVLFAEDGEVTRALEKTGRLLLIAGSIVARDEERLGEPILPFTVLQCLGGSYTFGQGSVALLFSSEQVVRVERSRASLMAAVRSFRVAKRPSAAASSASGGSSRRESRDDGYATSGRRASSRRRDSAATNRLSAVLDQQPLSSGVSEDGSYSRPKISARLLREARASIAAVGIRPLPARRSVAVDKSRVDAAAASSAAAGARPAVPRLFEGGLGGGGGGRLATIHAPANRSSSMYDRPSSSSFDRPQNTDRAGEGIHDSLL